MAEAKVAPEQALLEFEKMCAAREIPTSSDDWSEADKRGFQELRTRICTNISKGRVRISDNGDPVFDFATPALKLGQATGSALIAMDGKTGNRQVFAALADIGGIDISHFAKFTLPQLRVLEDFFILFFQR